MACFVLSATTFTFVTLFSLNISYATDSTAPYFLEVDSFNLTAQPLADEPNYRLPNNTEPIHYDIELSTNVHTGEREFTGKVTIQVRALEDTRSIVVHARQLSNFRATVRKETTILTYYMDYGYENEREFLSFTPRESNVNFQKGEIWVLTIQYSGTLRGDNRGFFMSSYTNENKNIRYLAATQFESTEARHAFPCFDEPSKRATFTITINHDPSYFALSNMPVDEERSSAGVTAFQKTNVCMPTYLVAFIVSDYKFTKGELNTFPHRVFSRPGTEGSQEWALKTGMIMLESLSEYFGVKFVLPKMDQVAVPEHVTGATENWGLVIYREGDLLYDEKKSTTFMQTIITDKIANEFVHQWFGNYVTPKWWSYLWMKEGFASLFAYEAVDNVYPEWNYKQAFHIDKYQKALSNDVDINAKPMTNYVQAPKDITLMYDIVSYAKASSVLSMWQHALGGVVFTRALRTYLNSNQFSSVEENDLFEAIQIAAKEENHAIPAQIADLMSSWTRQAGYPILNVTRNYDDGSFTIKQMRFYSNASHDDDQTWYIPLNYVTKSNPDFEDTQASIFILNTKDLVVDGAQVLSADWLLLNKQSTGYYRINYDEKNWGLITQGLLENPTIFHPRNRAQLMHDAYLFSMTNRLKKSILMSLLTYLNYEDQYAPWSTANEILPIFNFYLSGDPNYDGFKKYVAALVGNVYKKLGANENPDEPRFNKYTRAIVIDLACMVGIKKCLEDTNKKLIDFMEKNIKIERNLHSQIYCNGFKQSTDDVYQFFLRELFLSKDQYWRYLLISSLGCSQQQDQIKIFIKSSIDMENNLKSPERAILLRSTYSRGEAGLYACINFLKENWEAYRKLTTTLLNDDIRDMSHYIVNKDQEKAFLELLDLVNVTSVDKDLVEQAINTNFQWLQAHRDPIMGWISEYQKTAGKGSGTKNIASLLSVAVMLVSTRLL